MKVKMRVDITGTRDGKPWPGIGEDVDIPDDEGKDLCAAGIAEPVVDTKVQKATAPKAETR